MYPRIQVRSFEAKAFSKLRTSVSSCLLGMMHTLVLMVLPFHKLFFSKVKFLLFKGWPVFLFHQVCSPWCSIAPTWLNGFSGGTQLGTALPHSTMHPEVVPKFLVTSASRPKGFQGFMSVPCSAEYFGITSYESIQSSLLCFHLFLIDRTFFCPVSISLVTALMLDFPFWEVQLLVLDIP